MNKIIKNIHKENFWINLLKSLKVMHSQTDISTEYINIHDYFDKKYKVIIGKNIDADYVEMLEWLNRNSNKSVEIKTLDIEKEKNKWVKSTSFNKNNIAFIAFEDYDDALFFKIKYSNSIIE